MSMNLSRVDSAKLKAAIESAAKKLAETLTALEPLMVLLQEEERPQMLRARTDFLPMGKRMALVMAGYGDLTKLVGYNSAAAIEDAENLEALEPLRAPLAKLQQMIDDSRLTWLAELYEQTLLVYRAAKTHSANDSKLEKDLEPFREYFSKFVRTGKSKT